MSALTPDTTIDAFNQLRVTKQKLEVKRIRQPERFPNATAFAAIFGVEAAGAVLLHYRPGEEQFHARWYVEEVRDEYVHFSSTK
jgi:hypothetical protein